MDAAEVRRIPNHYTPPLSELDERMVRAVPPGGNWKDIPLSVPSRRLDQIRTSFAAGKGSRSTYYGRLRPDAPSYTIGTYFSRPGNGCHAHYDAAGGQDRLISQREAARLQSFPDSFVFYGSRTAINTQIGNAVPPLLAFQIATALSSEPCDFVDLFSGAGGLSLGFKWAGWNPVIGTDWDHASLTTYAQNVHDRVVEGDIRVAEVFDEVASVARAESTGDGRPFWVVGGPPCQGFSTAGNVRSLSDDRNHLFEPYRDLLLELEPDGFVFENVTGLMNMHGGKVLGLIKQELGRAGYQVTQWVLRAEEYAVPQRRHRVFLVGIRPRARVLDSPEPVTKMASHQLAMEYLPDAVSVEDALGDLPPLAPGQDGSDLDYVAAPATPYQGLMRGSLTPMEFLDGVRAGRR